MNMKKVMTSIAMILVCILVLVGCGSEKDEDKQPFYQEIYLPEELSYMTDVYPLKSGILIGGGKRESDLKVTAAIWQSSEEGWKIVFQKNFEDNTGYVEPQINILDKNACLIENNNWDIQSGTENKTECFYLEDFNKDTAVEVFKDSSYSGAVALGEYRNQNGYSLGYEKVRHKPSLNLYRIDIKRDMIQKEIEDIGIMAEQYMLIDDEFYIFSGSEFYKYNPREKKLDDLEDWNGIELSEVLKETRENGEGETKGRFVFQDEDIVYIGQKRIAKFSSKESVWYEMEEEGLFTDGKQIISVVPEKEDAIYIFYYDRILQRSKLCRIEI